MFEQETGKTRISFSYTIEIFKIIQRVVMVILTLLILWAMQFVGTEIAIMRKELTIANTRIGTLVSEIGKLEQRLGRSWFF